MKLKTIIPLFLLVFTLSINAQITADQKAKIDALFKDANENTPGAAIGVIKDGKLIYSNGYGMADLEHDIKMSPKSVFYMASVSKQFVTMAILLLEEQGKLSLDDEVQKHLPDFPRYESPLTIRHFIHHTSGVRDNLTLWALTGRSVYDHVDKEAIYKMIKRQKELNFKPGEKYLYSNSCYFMLAMMVEKVSGMSIREFARKNIFEPLGMTNTHFHDDQYHIVKNRVFSYAPSKNGYRNLIMRFDLVGSGGLYSNIEDLLKWDQNFYNNKLGKGGPELINKMLTDGKLNNGKSAGYAFGIQNGNYKGLRTVSHGGSLAGYRTYYVRFPDQNFSVFVLGNSSNFGPDSKSNAIAELMLASDFEAKARAEESDPGKETATGNSSDEQKKPATVNLSTDQLKKYSGFYWDNDEKDSWRVFIKADKLVVDIGGREVELIPISDGEFLGKGFPPSITLKFEKADGNRYGIVFNQNGALNKFSYYEPVSYSAADLKTFAGSYFSEELNFSYNLRFEGGKLKLFIGDKEISELKPILKDVFRSEGVGVFSFNRGTGGTNAGYKLDAGRVRNLKFDKM